MIYVPSTLVAPCRIAFLGEAPGQEEELKGEPFVGPSGWELTKVCNEAGFLRRDCSVHNVSRYRPPGNEIGQWIYTPTQKARRDGPPSGFVEYRNKYVRDFIPDHVEHLKAELIHVRPHVVVPLGNTGMWLLTGQEGITSWRGSILKSLPEFGGIKVIPTLHPAYVLRMWENRCDLVEDLRRANIEAATPDITIPQWEFKIRPTFTEAVGLLDGLLARLSVGPFPFTCDIETRKQQIACVGFGLSSLQAFCIPIMSKEAGGSYWSRDEELVIVKRIRDVLLHPNARVVNQNFLYDAYYFSMLWGARVIPHWDTMIAQHTCFPGKEKALHYICSLLCRYYCYWKDDGKEWDERKLPEDVLWRYNCMDCVYTYEAFEEQQALVKARGVEAQFAFQMSKFGPTLDMMIRGVRSDLALRRQFSTELAAAITQREGWLEKILRHPLNVRSHDQMKALFYEDLKLPVQTQRKTGQPTLDSEALKTLAAKEPLVSGIVNAVEDIRSFGVFKANFVDVGGPHQRFFTSLNITGTHTFRYSSSKNPFGWGGNLQNVPRNAPSTCEVCETKGCKRVDNWTFRCGTCGCQWLAKPDVRKLFVPDPGFVLCECDLERADAQIVAWEADARKLKELFRRGIDIHSDNAKVVGFARQMAKTFVHLTNYGGKPRTAARACGITVHQAEIGQRRWFGEHPEIREWHRRTEAELHSTHQTINVFGYKRFWFDRVDGLLPEALAWKPQSTVANVIDRALVRIDTELWPDVELLLQVHDSLLFQVRETRFDALIPRIQELTRVVCPYPDPLIIPTSFKHGLNRPWSELEDYHATENVA